MRISRYVIACYFLLVAAIIAVGLFGPETRYLSRLLDLKQAQAAAHPMVEPGQECSACHTSTHREPLLGSCDECHTTLDWRSATHRHAFPIFDEGAHEDAPCSTCHERGRLPSSTKCSSCHQLYGHKKDAACELCHNARDWQNSHDTPEKHPRLVGSHLKAACPDCHSLHKRKRTWSCDDCHERHTKSFRLTAGHAKRKCVECHKQDGGRDHLNTVATKGTECGACHKTNHGDLGECTTCHDTGTFSEPTFKHESAWPLTGAHEGARCSKCHPNGRWGKSAGKACVSCHRPRHAGLNDCARCHTTRSFTPSTFRHDSVYRLTGDHRRLACSKCHRDKQWAKSAGTSCTQCHAVQHAGLTSCATCHTTTSFSPSTYDHDRDWTLTGSHRSVACEKCHANRQWASTKGTRCESCHAVKHATLTDCATCHTTAGFARSTYRHDSWKLKGAHAKTACAGCHPDLQWATVNGTRCVDCHGRRHGGQTRCETCHTSAAWSPILPVKHTSSYPLIGQHAYVDCAGCHEGVIFSGTPKTCVSCHADKSHGMPVCETCHTPVSWTIVLPHHDMTSEARTRR